MKMVRNDRCLSLVSYLLANTTYRGIIPYLSQRLSFALPIPTGTSSGWLSSFVCYPWHSSWSWPPLVPVWSAQSIQVTSWFWTGWELLEGINMGSNELPCPASSVQCGSFSTTWTIFNKYVTPFHQTYAAREGPYQQRARDIYDELRKNVVINVFKVSKSFWCSSNTTE